jgi:peptidoglycan/LPS O-acetylase OafA/YrhL
MLRLLLPRLPLQAAPVAALGDSGGIACGISAANPTVIVLAAAATIASLAPERGLVARMLSWGPLVWLGRVSFSIYLLHAPLLYALNRALSSFIGPWALTALFVAILFPLSEATYRFIE